MIIRVWCWYFCCFGGRLFQKFLHIRHMRFHFFIQLSCNLQDSCAVCTLLYFFTDITTEILDIFYIFNLLQVSGFFNLICLVLFRCNSLNARVWVLLFVLPMDGPVLIVLIVFLHWWLLLFCSFRIAFQKSLLSCSFTSGRFHSSYFQYFVSSSWNLVANPCREAALILLVRY